MARRSHAKTRTGCATCKARRIKCKEEKPACRNCIKHGVQCPGYKEAQKNASRTRRPRSSSNRSAATVAKASTVTTPPRTQPPEYVEDSDNATPSLQSSSTGSPVTNFDCFDLRQDHKTMSPLLPSWTLPGQPAQQDATSNSCHDIMMQPSLAMNAQESTDDPLPLDDPHEAISMLSQTDASLLHAFSNAFHLVPSLTFRAEAFVWHDVNAFPTRWKSVMEAVLSFASTYMHFVTQDQTYLQKAFVHRGYALQSLQHDVQCGKEGIDAVIASSILLCDQAAYEGDWQSSILHHRGLANLCNHHLHESSDSMFTKTRMMKSPCETTQKRRVNIARIRASSDSMGCYSSIQSLKEHFLHSSANPDAKDPLFLGKDKTSQDTTNRQIQYSRGGIGHLIVMACDVHELQFEVAERSVSAMKTAALAEINAAILQSQTEGERWLSYLPQSIITEAFAGNPPALLLLAYKFALDLLLYRCTYHIQAGAPIVPPPSVVMAIAYIQHCYQEITAKNNPNYSASECQLFCDCMNWPLWVLDWASKFLEPELILAAVTNPQGTLPRLHGTEVLVVT